MTSPRSSPKKTSQKRPKDLLSRRLYFTPAERSKNLHHRQSRFWPISFAAHVTPRWRTHLYFRREHETGKHRLRTSDCVNSANTLSKHSDNTRPPRGTPGKDPAWKHDSCPLEWQGSATAPSMRAERAGGTDYFERNLDMFMKAKKWQHVTRLDDPGAPPNRATCLCFSWTREPGTLCQSLQQVCVPPTPHLALVLSSSFR